MSKGNKFSSNDFMMFSTMKNGGCGGCLVTALSIIGVVAFFIAVLIF